MPAPLLPPNARPYFPTPTSRFHASPLRCSLKPPPPATDDAPTVRTDAGRTRVSGIHVPRQKYISVEKNELLEAVISSFETEDEAREFARFSRCLDSLLHAEHKVLLEELRLSYSLAHLPKKNGDDDLEATSKDKPVKSGSWKNRINGQESDRDNRSPDYDDWDMRNLFGEYIGSASAVSDDLYRVDKAAKFQHAFMKILRNAQFEEISAEDLLLTRALKTDYLLTLPIYVDWKKAMESNAIIFRRGYATESQKGLLLVEKLDHLQSKLLQEVFFLLAKPLKRIGVWITEVLKQSNDDDHKISRLIEKAKLWLMEQYIPPNLSSYLNRSYGNKLDVSQSMDNSLPIWLASQRAVPLYEGLLSSVGPRGRLIRKLLSWTGLIPSLPEDSFKLSKESMQSEENLRPSYLSRVTISDIWRPATKEYCGNNVWKMFKTAVSILFRKSLLQEPAFQELILFYTGDGSLRSSGDKTDVLPLHLKIYEKIPIPDLPVIFPNKKLSFRILDTMIGFVDALSAFRDPFLSHIFIDMPLPYYVLRSSSSSFSMFMGLMYLLLVPSLVAHVADHYSLLNGSLCDLGSIVKFSVFRIRLDIASILGLLAYFLNYKFESTVSSPSAFLLDVVAISALIIYGSRVALGYKQTWDRYQLLVNRTLYEKTLASGFGSVHFLLDASEQQQYKEAILAYAFLLREGKYQGSSRESIKDSCEKFIFDKFEEKVEMPIDTAVETLMRFDIAKEVPSHDALRLEAVPCSAAFEVLKEHWDKLLQQST